MDADYSFLDYSFINFVNTESLLTSQYAKVIFHNIEEKYNLSHDLTCQYSLTEQFEANSGDRVVLFKLGWQKVTDYVLFEWVITPQTGSTCEVKFSACSLPQDTNEFYQLCYISCENAVCGASIPFQFTSFENVVTSTDFNCTSSQMDLDKEVQPSTSNSNTHTESFEADTTMQQEMMISVNNVDVKQIQEENKQLHNEIQKTNESFQYCDSQINDLKHEIKSLKSMLRVMQNDVSDLKLRMDLANEEYKKLYAEKTYEKSVNKCETERNKFVDSSSGSDACDFLGELEPLPPFPLLM